MLPIVDKEVCVMDWKPWMDAFLPALLEAFPGRVAFVASRAAMAGERPGRTATWIWWWCWTSWERRS